MSDRRTTRPSRRPWSAAVGLLLVAPLAACTDAEAPVGTGTAMAPSVPTATSPTSAPDATAPPAARTDVTADVLLPPDAFGEAEPAATGTVEAWRLPDACGEVVPEDATAMRTHVHGDGAYEAVVGIQQLAAFATADDAVAAAAGTLGEALAGCAGAEGTTYRAEEVPVGARGAGLATDHYDAGGDDAMGAYLVVTRRGSAVTLVSAEGGESTVGAARTTVTDQARRAWDLLCGYEAAGC
ncbi:hypothetical protein AB6N23_16145 [Cellulomonas sp. 179-A 9B4 NHS]|uniref:hypothetical protein n=1 Tax=Cellulomonas sp. 179-A 9B4 NHS TaxID=3142379 RepID=UPI0039A121D5